MDSWPFVPKKIIFAAYGGALVVILLASWMVENILLYFLFCVFVGVCVSIGLSHENKKRIPQLPDTCPNCGHPFDPHVLAAVNDPLEGGFMYCPEKDCPCMSTWSVPQAEELKKMRRDNSE